MNLDATLSRGVPFVHALWLVGVSRARSWLAVRSGHRCRAKAGGAPGRAGALEQSVHSGRDEAGGADAQIARGRARAGDCAGALAGFDAAISKTIEPTLRRDRGLCHEKLGHPFPAIDDYRAYLTARPDAPDADQIRQRLAALEEQAGVGGPSSQSVKDSGDDGGGSGSASANAGSGKAEASASVSLGGGGSSSSSSSSKESKARRDAAEEDGSGGSKGFDYYAAQEKKADDADNSALRYGEGFIFGAFLHFPRYFFGDGASSDAGYGVGATLRYALGGALTLTSEFGFAGVGTGGANSSATGPLLAAGVELKNPDHALRVRSNPPEGRPRLRALHGVGHARRNERLPRTLRARLPARVRSVARVRSARGRRPGLREA